MTKQEDENIDEEFSNLIREQLTDDEFWAWIRSWRDADDLAREAENWDTDTKKKEMIVLKKMIKAREINTRN